MVTDDPGLSTRESRESLEFVERLNRKSTPVLLLSLPWAVLRFLYRLPWLLGIKLLCLKAATSGLRLLTFVLAPK